MRLFAGTKFDQPPKCDRCGRLETECDCQKVAGSRLAASAQTARLSLEKRQKGKYVTVIRGLNPDLSDLPALLSQLKSQCGAGGALQDGFLEIQGDQLSKISAALRELGYQVRP
jgi:translation initiation factor 1